MKDSLINNSDTVFSSSFWEGLSVEIIGGVVAGIIIILLISFRKKIFPNKSDVDSSKPIDSKQKSKQIVNVEVNVNGDKKPLTKEPAESKKTLKTPITASKYSSLTRIERDGIIDSMKSKIKILFIDDDTKFEIVKVFKNDGWKNTSTVVDIKGLDIPVVKESDVYFVDINGVGKLLKCKYDGLDLAQMLKEKYPDKCVIIYSANKDQYAFHPAWDICDKKLEKNALPNQFEKIVEDYCIEINNKR